LEKRYIKFDLPMSDLFSVFKTTFQSKILPHIHYYTHA